MNVCNFTSFRAPLLGILAFLCLHSASWSQNKTTSTPPVNAAATVNQPKGGPVPELWVANRFEIKTGDDTPKISPSWAAFFPNGDYYPYFPEGGFWKFDLKRSDRSWGKAKQYGNKIVTDSLYGGIDFVKKSAEQMVSPDYPSNVWYRCASVDGLRIEGAYTHDREGYNRWHKTAKPLTPRPVIFFKKDGTFVNEGVSYANVTNSFDYAFGSGTYEIKNYSLILNYKGGKKRAQVGFATLKTSESTGQPVLYFINNLVHYKLKG